MTEYIDDQGSKYEQKRVRAFINRTRHAKNLALEFRPVEPFDHEAFVDRIIKAYVDSSVPNDPENEKGVRHYEENLGRAAFTTLFLKGVSYHDLQAEIQDDPRALKRGVTEHALQVAGLGARYLTLELRGGEQIEQEVQQEPLPDLEVLKAYADLPDTIERLSKDHRIEEPVAQAMFLLFELATSSAHPKVIMVALERVRSQLLNKTRNRNSESVTDMHQSLRLEKGIVYIQRIVGDPFKKKAGLRMKDMIIERRLEVEMPNEESEVRAHVLSYIGNALEHLYPPDNG
jgi:hypothetical protein